jgi:hypothetical protein
MLDLSGAFFVPTLDPARRPPAMVRGLTLGAGGDGLRRGRCTGYPDRPCEHMVTLW